MEAVEQVLARGSRLLGEGGSYITDADLPKLRDYQYHSLAGTRLDDLLNRIWWEPLSHVVPLWVHPNTLTVVALLFSWVVAFWPIQFFSLQGDAPVPRVLYLVSAFAYFAYQSLDAVDGKQARKLGLSSPLGQLMDHGCDALTTIYTVFLLSFTIQIGSHPSLVALILTGVVFQLYYYGWYEYKFGVFKTATAETGVTEGQCLVMLISLLTFLFPKLWGSTLAEFFCGVGRLFGVLGAPLCWLGRLAGLLTLNMHVSTIAATVCGALMIQINYSDAKSVLDEPPKPLAPSASGSASGSGSGSGSAEQLRAEWLALGFQLYVQIAICLSHTLARHPFPVANAMCFAGAQVAWRLMLASLVKKNFTMIDRVNAPYYVGMLLASCGVFGHGWIEGVLLWLLSAYTIASSIAFASINMYKMKAYLNIPLFVVPDNLIKQASAKAAAPANTAPPANTAAPANANTTATATAAKTTPPNPTPSALSAPSPAAPPVPQDSKAAASPSRITPGKIASPAMPAVNESAEKTNNSGGIPPSTKSLGPVDQSPKNPTAPSPGAAGVSEGVESELKSTTSGS